MRDLLPFLKLYLPHSKRLWLGILLAFITLLTSIGLLTTSGWFLAASAVAGLVIATKGDFNYLIPAGAVRMFSVLRTVSRWAERVVSHDATFRVLSTLRCWFYRRLGPLTQQELKGLRNSELLNRMVADVDALDHLYLRLFSPIIAGTLTILLLSGLLYWFDPKIGLIMAALMLSLLFILPVLFYSLGNKPGQQQGIALGELRLHLVDYLQAHTEFTLFAAQATQRQKIAKQEQLLIQAQRKMAIMSGFSSALMTMLNGWIVVLMFILAADGIGQSSPPGPLLAMLVFATLASFEALTPVNNAFLHLSATVSAARRLKPILEIEPQIQYGTLPVATTQPAELVIDSLQYQYTGAQQATLNNINLTLKAGEKIALLGQTGSGKSTLLDLITRQLLSQSGAIRLNKKAIEDYDMASFRASICHISQRVHIFNDTLADNLRIASPLASAEELEKVLRWVKLEKLLDGEGLSQWLGDGGRQLSGGEQRRLGVARALLHPAPILLLDEPTEGLDQTTELEVIDILISHRPERSLLYITHRPAALALMDRCLLLDDGQLKAYSLA